MILNVYIGGSSNQEADDSQHGAKAALSNFQVYNLQ